MPDRSMRFIAIQTPKLPLRTQLIEFLSNPAHAMNALITRNIRRFDKTVTKSDSVSIAALRATGGSKCIRFKRISCATLTALFIVTSTRRLIHSDNNSIDKHCSSRESCPLLILRRDIYRQLHPLSLSNVRSIFLTFETSKRSKF